MPISITYLLYGYTANSDVSLLGGARQRHRPDGSHSLHRTRIESRSDYKESMIWSPGDGARHLLHTTVIDIDPYP